MIDYDTLSFKKFFKILKDESKVSLLEVGNEEENRNAWEEIKSEYKLRHPDPREEVIVTAYKKVLIETINCNRNVALFTYLLSNPENLKDLFKELNLKWFEGLDERAEYLKIKIDKSKQKVEIYQAQLEKLKSELPEEKEETKVSIERINESIASLSLHGFSITNFETLTCGQYDAYSKIAKQKANASKR